MGFKMKGNPMQRNFGIGSPLHQEKVVIDGKTYPKGYTKKDVKFLKEQKEDVVRYEDLDEKGKAIWKSQGKKVPAPTKHQPWAKAHKNRPDHSATPEAHNAQPSPTKKNGGKAKMSHESAHGQLNDAKAEYENDKKMLKNDGIGEGFMNPPYRGPKGKGPREKRQGYHGYENFTSNLADMMNDPEVKAIMEKAKNWRKKSKKK